VVLACETPRMRIRFLGTGTPTPDPQRCGSGTAIVFGPASGWLLIDCGPGIARRVLEARLDLCGLAGVLLTHHHSDHVSDLANLAISRFIAGAPTALRVVAAEGPCVEFASRCLDAFDDSAFYSQRRANVSIRPELDIVPFAATNEPTVVHQDGQITARAVLVDHGPMEAAVGYRICTDSATVAISGDTAVCPGVRLLADGADVLVHQALLSDSVSRSALAWNASARSVGELAQDAGVKHLVLTHLMPTPANASEEEAFGAEARSSGYKGPLSMPQDLDTLDVP
jgi:ribonuclease Z